MNNLEKINALNEKHPLTVFGITQFTDLTEEEFRNFHRLQISDIANTTTEEYDDSNWSAPSELDWRTKHVVTEVKNQGLHCGSCYIFGSIGNIESQYARKYNELLSLSESQVLDCGNVGGCGGGWPTNVLEYCNNGVELEADYPYVPQSQTCKFEANKLKVKVTDFKEYDALDSDPEKLKNLLFDKGPLTMAFEASSDLAHYHGGVCTPNLCTGKPNHAVLLVGYGKTSGVDTWIVKNSWGTQWGDKGYLYFDFARMKDCAFSVAVWTVEVEKV